MFSSKNSIVSGLMFRSLVLLSLYLCMVLESVLISLFYMELTTGLLAKESVVFCLFFSPPLYIFAFFVMDRMPIGT